VRPGRGFRQAAGAGAVTFDAQAAIECVMLGARLNGGAANSTMVIRETDGAGAILAELSCVIGADSECRIPISFRRALHVTVTGAGASGMVYV
jgi:hypothetical protein